MELLYVRPRARRMRYVRVDPYVTQDNENIFYEKYRFAPRHVEMLEEMLSPLLPDSGEYEPHSISKRVQILIFLRYLSSNGFQSLVGDVFGGCQKTVSSVVTNVLDAINHPDIVARFMKFLPHSPEWCAERASEFSRICGLSNVIGAVDGCLIKIQQPSVYGWQYFCRKACTAIILIPTVDARGKFLYINCRFPGSCHDSSMWRKSGASRIFESGRATPGFRLMGDAGFANSASIMTPYRARAAQREARKARFNVELSEGRVVVEQAFGALKRRFGILENVARIEPPKVQKIIQACVILYNIAIEVGAQDGQPLSSVRLAEVPHPPPGVDPRDFLMRHFLMGAAAGDRFNCLFNICHERLTSSSVNEARLKGKAARRWKPENFDEDHLFLQQRFLFLRTLVSGTLMHLIHVMRE